MGAASKTETFTDYHIADLSLADWGRKGTEHCRNRNARLDGHSQKNLRRIKTTQRCAYHRLFAHDDPDRCVG
jgi:hypothetical protein